MNNTYKNHLLSTKSTITIFCISLLIGCGGSGSSNTNSTKGSTPKESTSNETTPGAGETSTQVTGNNCVSENNLGITALPKSSSALYKTSFCKYIPLTVPNGKSIGFFAQQKVSDDQLVRAQRILSFYLRGKENIANHMANNNAHMMLLNGADGDIELAEGLQGQPLYEKEMIVEGSTGYLSSDYQTYRDASFEEILHLMHDYGIGTESQPGADMQFSQQIKAAREAAMQQNLWPTASVSQDTLNWIEELRQEGSLSQEYLASVLDSYYGLWQNFNEPGGMWGIYSAKTRSDIQTQDPLGYAVMQTFFQPNLSYLARIDANFNGTFSMTFDNNQSYTYKSQYLTHARLTGTNDSNLEGNALDNQLAGNSGSNLINGKEGDDILLLQGKQAEYSIQKNSNSFLIQDSANSRDGLIEIRNIERIKFSDKILSVNDL